MEEACLEQLRATRAMNGRLAAALVAMIGPLVGGMSGRLAVAVTTCVVAAAATTATSGRWQSRR